VGAGKQAWLAWLQMWVAKIDFFVPMLFRASQPTKKSDRGLKAAKVHKFD